MALGRVVSVASDHIDTAEEIMDALRSVRSEVLPVLTHELSRVNRHKQKR